MRILLTGATGFVGARLLEFLLEEPTVELVICLARDWHPPDQTRARWVTGDVQSSDWHAIVDCVDVVIHAAANASFGTGDDHEAVNHQGTLQVLEFARRAGASRFIYLSTIGAVDRSANDRSFRPLDRESPPSPRSAYGRSKLRAEDAVKQSGLCWTIIRPAWVYGSGMRRNSHLCVLAAMTKRHSPVAAIDWPGRVSMVHVDDLCRLIVRISCLDDCRNETIFAAAESVSLGEIFRMFGTAWKWNWAGKIPVPKGPCRALAVWLHRFMPLTVASLLADYLSCETASLHAWLAPRQPLLFRSRFNDVVAVIEPLRKKWLVTGAGSGIGRALCELLEITGTIVIGVDRAFPSPPPATTSQRILDLTAPGAVERLRAVVESEDVSVVINNAGVGFRGEFTRQSPEQVRATLALNVAFPVEFTHAIIDLLERRRGILVNVASSVAGVPLPQMCLYSASKGFIQTWSIGLAEEMRRTMVVVTVAPTGTNTNFQRTAGVKGGQTGLLSPVDVATAIIRGVSEGRTFCFVGPWHVRVALLSGGALPASLQAKLWGFLFGNFR